ncbi:hypothetical protein PFISCL1PPCAC_28859, partial [Pristionchus fissidentatus]
RWREEYGREGRRRRTVLLLEDTHEFRWITAERTDRLLQYKSSLSQVFRTVNAGEMTTRDEGYSSGRIGEETDITTTRIADREGGGYVFFLPLPLNLLDCLLSHLLFFFIITICLIKLRLCLTLQVVCEEIRDR